MRPHYRSPKSILLTRSSKTNKEFNYISPAAIHLRGYTRSASRRTFKIPSPLISKRPRLITATTTTTKAGTNEKYVDECEIRARRVSILPCHARSSFRQIVRSFSLSLLIQFPGAAVARPPDDPPRAGRIRGRDEGRARPGSSRFSKFAEGIRRDLIPDDSGRIEMVRDVVFTFFFMIILYIFFYSLVNLQSCSFKAIIF